MISPCFDCKIQNRLMDAQTYSFDLQRIFVGDLPLLFLLEIAFRTVIIFLYALLLLRFIGKRGLGQLTPFEFAIIIALGSAVGDPMFYPDVPIFHSMVVITIVVLLQRGIVEITRHNDRLEEFIESSPSKIVQHGLIQLDGLEHERLSEEEVYSMLREAEIEVLSQVERAYLEPSGKISVIRRAKETVPLGLPLIPPDDEDYPAVGKAGDTVTETTGYACIRCGNTRELKAGTSFDACPRCEHTAWIPARSPIPRN